MGSADSTVRRIGIASGDGRGPVTIKEDESDIYLVTFVGEDEADVLHAAADWASEHPMSIIRGLNFVDLNMMPGDVDQDVIDESILPRHVLKMTVDRCAEHT